MMEQSIFYILAAAAVISTLLAITARHPVHAVLFLVLSLLSIAIIFYMLAAPMVAAFEVIIYAGAIMVLFLFVIMMLDLGHPEKGLTPHLRQWLPAISLTIVSLGSFALLVISKKNGLPATSSLQIREVARILYQKHGLAVELVSLQLLFALVGALYQGRPVKNGDSK